jgi:hypothetical protein
MAAPSTTDVGRRDPLPSISHLELDKLKPERLDTRYPSMNGLSVSTAPMGSPNTVHSGPPPPYSYPPSAAASNLSNHAMSGYISPPESTRRSTREEERHSPPRKSLPSIHEALGGDRALPFTGSSQPAPGSTPSSALTQNFPDGPKGPSNPFSAPPIREHPFPRQLQPPSHLQAQPTSMAPSMAGNHRLSDLQRHLERQPKHYPQLSSDPILSRVLRSTHGPNLEPGLRRHHHLLTRLVRSTHTRLLRSQHRLRTLATHFNILAIPICKTKGHPFPELQIPVTNTPSKGILMCMRLQKTSQT